MLTPSDQKFARKVSVFGWFAIVATCIIAPPIGLTLVGILFIRKAYRAYLVVRADRILDARLEALAREVQDRPARGAGYRTRIIIPENPQDHRVWQTGRGPR